MIAWYAHHQGQGHVQRAQAIARHLAEPVTGLSTLPAPEGWRGPWVELPPDDAPAEGVDPRAGGAFHWAPLGHPGASARFGRLGEWLQKARPRLLVVDVSVEVAVFARLLGVPTAIFAMPGRRDDAPHQLAFSTCSLIVAPWPAWAKPASGLEPWAHKTVHTGSVSRFAGRRAPEPAAGPRRALVLGGAGGTAVGTRQVSAARRATPAWSWRVLGPPAGWEPDPWTSLTGADVVITHAGQGALADTAVARRPAVVVPQDRPHDEQRAGARAVGEAGLAVVRERWPDASEWPRVLRSALELGGSGWERWGADEGARLAAEAIEACASR